MEEKVSNIKTIYIQLLDEGTVVYRPTKGLHVHRNVYRVLATPDYDEKDERWEFAPGSLVYCEQETLSEKKLLVAKSLVNES